MDYTLAQYNSPAYEMLSYDLIMQKLVQMGYPASIQKLSYNPAFPIRGLLLDTQLGHLIKVDLFGHVLCCIHGHKRLQKQEIAEIYPSLYIPGEAIGHR
jgi:5'-nucleotidase